MGFESGYGSSGVKGSFKRREGIVLRFSKAVLDHEMGYWKLKKGKKEKCDK